jgi:hypothetical protein
VLNERGLLCRLAILVLCLRLEPPRISICFKIRPESRFVPLGLNS